MKKSFFLTCFLAVFLTITAFAQDVAPENWFTSDYNESKVRGASVDKAYRELLNGVKAKPVIVGVIDSGVEADHEDLKSRMWVNKGEIPGNGIDDDKNGYVDDIHGWNFIGGKDGRNIDQDSYEATRVYATLMPRFKDADPAKISKKDKKDYELYLKLREDIEKKKASAESNLNQMEMTFNMLSGPLNAVKEALGRKKATLENINAIDAGEDQNLNMGKMIMTQIIGSGQIPTENMDSIIILVNSELQEGINHFKNQVEYSYNVDFDPRKEIVNDNYNDYSEKYYGNNDVEGPDAFHGTHVSGIIAADRTNDKGIRGIADQALIMSIRAVPDGDERDKDIANAIRYAVDNGAKVINMSFGKGYSPGKKYVDEAVKYAAKKDVLLVHAAGNSSENNDSTANFPNDKYAKKGLFGKKYAANWIEVGALSWQNGDDQVAEFSNFGKSNVDIFAPGVDIYSTIPGQGYKKANGTSMASPVVAGVAAMLRSYFPSLTAVETKEIILQSAKKLDTKVKKPGSDTLVPFSDLSTTGGYIDAYEAVKLAARKTGTKLSSSNPDLNRS